MKKNTLVVFASVLLFTCLLTIRVYASSTIGSDEATVSEPSLGDIGQISLASASVTSGGLSLRYYTGSSPQDGSNYSTQSPTTSKQICNDVQYYLASSTGDLYKNLNKPADFITTLPRNSLVTAYTQTSNTDSSCISGLYFSGYWGGNNAENGDYSIRPISNTKVANSFVLTFQILKNGKSLNNTLVEPIISYGYYDFNEPASKTVYDRMITSNNDGTISLKLNNEQDNKSDELTVSFLDELGSYGSYTAAYPLSLGIDEGISAVWVGTISTTVIVIIGISLFSMKRGKKQPGQTRDNIALKSLEGTVDQNTRTD